MKIRIDKYSTLFSLYLAQSIPMSFFSTVMPVIMRMEHYSLESIGYLQLVKLPWILKFLWAPMIDRSSRNTAAYRRWIIGSELFYALVILHIGFFDLQTDFSTIIALLIVAFTASATQDIATDAFAILSLKKEERSLGNSMQSAGSFMGTLFGSGLLLILYHYWGWYALLIGLSTFVLLALIPLLLYKNKTPAPPQAPAQKVSPFAFVHFFRQKKLGGHIVVLLLFYTGIIGILSMVKPYLVDLGYNIKSIGFISGIFGTACGALVTIPMGFFIKRYGMRKAAWLAALSNMSVALFFYAISSIAPPTYLIYIGVAMLWGSYAISTVFIYTLAMDMVRPGREGTDFTIQIVLTHLSSLVIGVFSGKVADIVQYQGLFLIEIGINLLIITLFIFFFKSLFHNTYAHTTATHRKI